MKRFIPALAVACLFTAPLSAQSLPNNVDITTRVVVVVLAHPDDELVFAPAIHAMAREGFDVHLIFATDGDQGPGVMDMEPGEELGKVRRKEAVCSGSALRAELLTSFALGDGTLGLRARDPDSAANQLKDRLPRHLGEATTVITWGPDGGYGHSDHRMVSAVVTQLVQAMPSESRPRLLYPALIHTPLPEPLASQGWATTAPDLATVRIAYNDADLAAAAKAAQCHKTQFDDATRAMIVPGFHAGVWKGEVAFRRAF